jgi:hypothetical protein
MRLLLILLPWMMSGKLLRCPTLSLHTQWAPIVCGGLRRVGSLHGDGGRDGGTTAAAATLGSRTRSQGPRSSFLARTFSTSGRSGVEANAPGTVAAFSSLEGAAALLPVGHRYRLVQIRCIGGTYQQSARKRIGTESRRSSSWEGGGLESVFNCKEAPSWCTCQGRLPQTNAAMHKAFGKVYIQRWNTKGKAYE